MARLLEMRGISKSFPGVKALDDIHFELEAGEVHALLGENGAGKSTLIKVLGGIYRADEGEIWMEGQRRQIQQVVDAEAAGISIIHQELVLVPQLTVAENIYLGREQGPGCLVRRRQMLQEAQELLDRLQIPIRASRRIAELSIAEQQMVEIAKALSRQARILVMDEPSSSISDSEVEKLFGMIRELRAKGVGIIYISHKMSELEEICDRVTVMRDGRTVATLRQEDCSKDELISLMVGRTLTRYFIRDFQDSPGPEILRVEALRDGEKVQNLSFSLHEGEIVGFAGLIGAGRSEAMQLLFGLRRVQGGQIYLHGEPIQIKSPQEAMSRGLALVPESRKDQGLYMEKDLYFNTSIEVLSQFIRHGWVRRSREREIARRSCEQMRVKTASLSNKISSLSGGNQQKVLIGRWLATAPRILILDEPTRGIDVGAKAEIYSIINELAKSGVSIILISSELPEVINMSDRIYVMAHGAVRACFRHDEVSQERIMHAAAAE